MNSSIIELIRERQDWLSDAADIYLYNYTVLYVDRKRVLEQELTMGQQISKEYQNFLAETRYRVKEYEELMKEK